MLAGHNNLSLLHVFKNLTTTIPTTFMAETTFPAAFTFPPATTFIAATTFMVATTLLRKPTYRCCRGDHPQGRAGLPQGCGGLPLK